MSRDRAAVQNEHDSGLNFIAEREDKADRAAIVEKACPVAAGEVPRVPSGAMTSAAIMSTPGAPESWRAGGFNWISKRYRTIAPATSSGLHCFARPEPDVAESRATMASDKAVNSYTSAPGLSSRSSVACAREDTNPAIGWDCEIELKFRVQG